MITTVAAISSDFILQNAEVLWNLGLLTQLVQITHYPPLQWPLHRPPCPYLHPDCHQIQDACLLLPSHLSQNLQRNISVDR